jgi:hypothetical protein
MTIINQDENLVVPDKTIAVFPVKPINGLKPFDMNYQEFLKPLNTTHKRTWFTPHFYHCLPLSIGNMQGFSISLPFEIELFWNGGNEEKDLKIIAKVEEQYIEEYFGVNCISLSSHFGHGIVTINLPIQLKTPPGINLMTLAAPNFPLSGLSAMTGVVESDNLRFTFTINLKVTIPNAPIIIEKNYPIASLLPIPRYFCDSFELKNAIDIFDKKIVDNEVEVVYQHTEKREESNKNKSGQDKIYYNGMDVLGNKFKDHQLPKKKKRFDN